MVHSQFVSTFHVLGTDLKYPFHSIVLFLLGFESSDISFPNLMNPFSDEVVAVTELYLLIVSIAEFAMLNLSIFQTSNTILSSCIVQEHST